MNFLEKDVTCFLPFGDTEKISKTIHELRTCSRVGKIFTINPDDSATMLPEGCNAFINGLLQQTRTLKKIISLIDTPYTMLYTQTVPLQLGAYAIERMLRVISDTGSGLLYADRYRLIEEQLIPYPVNDYQEGSLRDDFDFGSLLLYRSSSLIDAVNEMDVEYQTAALYDLRLKVSQRNSLFHLPEYLYTELETNFPSKFQQSQEESEYICTQHLKNIGAWLKPEFTPVDFSCNSFPVEATVVMPTRNREKTIEDAIRSVLIQETNFSMNLIVIDNHSTDKTTGIVSELASSDNRIIHLIPEKGDLGIGGSWNHAIMHPKCGKFTIQLDSDDLYIHQHVVQTIVNVFYEQNCAMVVGTYQLVDFHLQEIPFGIVDHREWTPANGRNNALRMHGFGAPRAFYTPILRKIMFPNSNYGEDYAVGLAISREYRIGRIYQTLYLCRRWDDNTDASLDVYKQNVYHHFKDCIRTIELQARKNRN